MHPSVAPHLPPGRPRRVLAALLPLLIGCTARDAPRSVVPDAPTARRAVEVALAAWRRGRPSGVVEPTTPRVQVVDTHRRPGQTLDAFEILGQAGGERHRTVTARLSLLNPAEGQTVRFCVLGIDPILVFRQEDLDLISHWDHRMDPAQVPP